MNIRYVLYIILLILLLHVILYFFNIDLFDYYEIYVLNKNDTPDMTLTGDINELQQSLEELKEITDN